MADVHLIKREQLPTHTREYICKNDKIFVIQDALKQCPLTIQMSLW